MSLPQGDIDEVQDQDSTGTSSHEDSQISSERPFSHEVAQWLRSFRIQWLGQSPGEIETEKPKLGPVRRFLIALIGAMTFWFVGSSYYILKTFEISDEPGTTRPQLGIIEAANEAVLIFTFALSVWFAWLISWRDNQFGPVRIYLSALLLSAFVFEIITRVWPQ